MLDKNFLYPSDNSPLTLRLRPRTIEEFVGQEHILGRGKLLKRVVTAGKFHSLIFYGAPGSGKTTLGFIIARRINADLQYVNAAFSSVKEIKGILTAARDKLERENKKTILFIDEIHRFNKLQQETLIPDTEAGTIILIGTTVYNPRYYLINSLISRAVIAEFKPLSDEDIIVILKRALQDKEMGLGKAKTNVTSEALEYIAAHSSGDARKALDSLEIGVLTTAANKYGEIKFDLGVARETIQKNIFYDRKGTYHYDTISAFIKSVRGSDPDSALYWLAKMIVSAEDARFIARRLTILASEDIGNADPSALTMAVSCFQAVEFVGFPEAQLILAQTTLYLACAPKSNASYKALQLALEDVNQARSQGVPDHIKTYSKDYKYPHSYGATDSKVGSFVKQDYGARRRYYFPSNVGVEKRLKYFLDRIRNK